MPEQQDLFNAITYAKAVVLFRDALRVNCSTLNRLNVFPVPDGDTGTNMFSTVDCVAKDLGDLDDNASMAEVAAVISKGSLMGARGNSGVILCQILRAFSVAMASGDAVGPSEVASGLVNANEAARAAVQRPVEGTILSVIAAGAQEATVVLASEPANLARLLKAAHKGVVEALWRTPSQLAVLSQAGVVDAGGAGLTLFFAALVNAFSGLDVTPELELPPDVALVVQRAESGSTGILNSANEPGEKSEHDALAELRFEVMYFLEAPDEAIAAFRNAWAVIGDSIVVVGGDGLFNCHIHTDDIGASIEAGLDVGRPRQIRVTDLALVPGEETWVRNATTENPTDPPRNDKVEHPALAGLGVTDLDGDVDFTTAVVAVATGDGIRRIFASLGARAVIAGGQTMNPSTAEILEVINFFQTSDVVILPNNSNIVAVAQQAAALAAESMPDRKVKVVPTLGVQEGLAALVDYDPQVSGEENAAVMQESQERISAGEVTIAVRSTTCEVGPIDSGDYIAIGRQDGIVAVNKDLGLAVTGLLEHLIRNDSEIVTLLEGDGSSSRSSRQIVNWMAEKWPKVQVELLRGGQPLYPYLVSVE